MKEHRSRSRSPTTSYSNNKRVKSIGRIRRIPYGPLTEDYKKILVWQSKEGEFILSQAKKRAELRVQYGRETPIDILAVHLRIIDKTEDFCEEQPEHAEVVLKDPVVFLETLNLEALEELEKEINQYLKWETEEENIEFWRSIDVIRRDQILKLKSKGHDNGEFRLSRTIEAQVDSLLKGKTKEELEILGAQIDEKLQGETLIDVDYWEKMKECLIVWKSRVILKELHKKILHQRREALKNQQLHEGRMDREALKNIYNKKILDPNYCFIKDDKTFIAQVTELPDIYQETMDPEPLSILEYEDKKSYRIHESAYQDQLISDRDRILRSGFVPIKMVKNDIPISKNLPNTDDITDDSFSTITNVLYEREASKGENDDEELFNVEEEIIQTTPSWADTYRPRKPKFFNRVQTGYDWNRYNQVHYDANNPPPKVIQGYKFNIFYPDLIDKTKAPTYRIERNKKKNSGQDLFSEDETCLIRFIAGPPYEDIAFRIIDKDWDYSAKRERGFKSSFDKGVLHLSFQFKKVFYRK
ncbi:hypothetical protein PNEG_03065 [Pneumocystis murina B123]|uniref:Splicing factor Cactin n=1 Tax=Pneumocystis murina (strain B123) TaxID=1069680 RepID=M7PDP2_PNEMU|nr:hypothetical protein PNEG_03065 [Pneumocystis murina B123]EMR08589.1 hypothetical protein PNEG_03065 [Pneumocystis murina B123]